MCVHLETGTVYERRKIVSNVAQHDGQTNRGWHGQYVDCIRKTYQRSLFSHLEVIIICNIYVNGDNYMVAVASTEHRMLMPIECPGKSQETAMAPKVFYKQESKYISTPKLGVHVSTIRPCLLIVCSEK